VGSTEAPAKLHLSPEVTKLVPVTVTVDLTRAGLGENETFGTTLKVADAESKRFPLTVIAATDCAGMPAPPTTNEPVTTPAVIVQLKLAAISGVPPAIVQVVSPELNPVPETVIVSPPLPLFAENTTVG
jgi:hypothetical protein